MRLGNCDAAYPESISLLPLQLCAFSRSSSQPKLGPASVVPHHVRYASRYKGTGSCHSKTASCTATTERAQKSCMAVLCDSEVPSRHQQSSTRDQYICIHLDRTHYDLDNHLHHQHRWVDHCRIGYHFIQVCWRIRSVRRPIIRRLSSQSVCPAECPRQPYQCYDQELSDNSRNRHLNSCLPNCPDRCRSVQEH